jgi:steroid 5-alpha reductase family enzyme
MSPLVFLLFNLSFIATYQNILLFIISCPAYIVMGGPASITTADACVAALFSVFLLIETVADEQHWVFQSYKHSLSTEERKTNSNPEIVRGFYSSGLFRYCRHPNYCAEQAIWVCVYLFSITGPTGPTGTGPTDTGSMGFMGPTDMGSTGFMGFMGSMGMGFMGFMGSMGMGFMGFMGSMGSQNVLNWTILGCVQLVLLFQGSMSFGESITASKYPKYKEYQKSTPQCIPYIPYVYALYTQYAPNMATWTAWFPMLPKLTGMSAGKKST